MTSAEEHKPTWVTLAILLVTTLLPAGLIGFLLKPGMSNDAGLRKPVFSPPGWLFPAVWAALYALMALSVYLAMRQNGSAILRTLALYYAQLIVSLAWPVLFFAQKAYGLSFVWLVLLLALAIILVSQLFKGNKLSGWLMTPYLAWLIFSCVLNFAVAYMNAKGSP